jgi:hypothetical protein
MVPSTGNNVHTSSLVPCGLEVVDRNYAAHWVHPVMFAVCTKSQRGSEQGTQRGARTDEGYGNFQCCDPVYQRHACMGTRSQYMRWKTFQIMRGTKQ